MCNYRAHDTHLDAAIRARAHFVEVPIVRGDIWHKPMCIAPRIFKSFTYCDIATGHWLSIWGFDVVLWVEMLEPKSL